MNPDPPQFPAIPNFTILSRIGGGAYGEVYLARSVTGLFRAVKVVSRENFELEKTFEREFQGIQRYERVSQGHPGLVDVLHVGREESANFYYYVMELADHETGETIDSVEPAEYRGKTLTSLQKVNPTMSIDDCVSLGTTISEALGHLHRAGLTHRDVKPSNIIYINGKPQLADIGLVAASGQRTFVGTEGYVPPEGPGTSSADLYALAMVLYEMQTGNDRLEFPELPTNHQLAPTVNRDQWRALNAVICRAGSPDPKKRFETGQFFSSALNKVIGSSDPQSSTTKRGSLVKNIALIASVLVIGLMAFLIIKSRSSNDTPSIVELPVTPPEVIETPIEGDSPVTEVAPENPAIKALPVAEKVTRRVKLDSVPKGASVWVNGESLGTTPLPLKKYELGELDLVLKFDGYFEKQETLQVKVGELPLTHISYLKQDLRPTDGEPWTNAGDMDFTISPSDGKYIAGVSRHAYKSFLNSTDSSGTIFAPNEVVQVKSNEQRWSFCDWMTKVDRQVGYLSDQQYYVPIGPRDRPGAHELYCFIENKFGSLVLESTPDNVDIYDASGGGAYLGKAPISLQRRIGPYRLMASKSGYANESIDGYLTQDAVSYPIKLTKDNSVVFGQPWTNSLGMPMVPVNSMMVATFETRKKDFDLFLREGNFNSGVFPPEFSQSEDHPLVRVNRSDAAAFCEWLTKYEKANKRIQPSHQYRLPTDLEWSKIAGLAEARGASPILRESEFQDIYPWGKQWPPPADSGNFADTSAPQLGQFIIANYTDEYPHTAPVGSFKANLYGIHDLAGNVWEWVTDDYGDGSTIGVVRGGGWESYQKGILFTSYRNSVQPTSRSDKYGFRFVLVDTNQAKPVE